jgi:pimeloyl-ACP methyl ester carboxylesterase
MKQKISVYAILMVCCLAAARASAQQTPRSNWAELNGNKIHYYDIGDRKNKNALVFIHGWSGNVDLWRDSYNAFPKYRVITVDLMGHGRSDKPKVDYTMELFARTVEAVLRKAKVEKAVLVGHSMGMPVARQFYRLFPNKTLGIVNVDGSIRAFPDTMQFENLISAFKSDYAKTRDGFIESMVQPIKDEKVKQAIRSSSTATPEYVGISAISQFGNKDLWTTDPIKVPVLAVLADSPWWPADTETFHRSISPDLEFHMWKGVTHFLFMEDPAKFNNTTAAWIEKKKLL